MLKLSKRILSIFLSILTLTACNAEKETGESPEVQTKILDSMAKQDHYSFNGTTKLTMDETKVEDAVNFNGFIHEKENFFLKLNIAPLEGMPEEKMEILQTPDEIMLKYGEADWERVDEESLAMFSEFRNWNPEFMLSRIRDLSTSTKSIEGKEGNKGLLIQIDSEEIKKQIENTMKSTLNDGTLTEEDIKDMKENFGMTDEEIAQMQEELQVQLVETEKQINEMIKTMEVEAFYEVYYDPSSFLVNEILQNTKTSYKLEGQDVNEDMTINIEFSDYGKEQTLPTT